MNGASATTAPSAPASAPSLRHRQRRPIVPTSPQSARAWSTGNWVLYFVLLQIACQLLLLFPSLGPVRVLVRVAAMGGSLGLLFLLPRKGWTHPSTIPAIGALLVLAVQIFHPFTNNLVAGVATVMMYAAILAPLFWVTRTDFNANDFRRLILVLWSFHTLSAVVGVLQVYFPGRFEPALSSVIVSQGEQYVEDMKIVLPSGERVFRPMGLTDSPGGASGAGYAAILFGIGIFTTDKRPWLRFAALGSLPVGLLCIYLSQVRSILVMCVICVIAYIVLMALRGEMGKVVTLSTVAIATVIGSFLWAYSIGGELVFARLAQFLDDKPGQVYYQNRGRFLDETVNELLPQWPMGAGLGRWGMVNYYFSDNSIPDKAMIWAEIQWTGWLLDGGLPLIAAYVAAIGLAFWMAWRVAIDPRFKTIGLWAALVLAIGTGDLASTFNYPLFMGQGGMEFWMLNAALFMVYKQAIAQKQAMVHPVETGTTGGLSARASRHNGSSTGSKLPVAPNPVGAADGGGR